MSGTYATKEGRSLHMHATTGTWAGLAAIANPCTVDFHLNMQPMRWYALSSSHCLWAHVQVLNVAFSADGIVQTERAEAVEAEAGGVTAGAAHPEEQCGQHRHPEARGALPGARAAAGAHQGQGPL